jgi:hypothetical protein
MSSCPGLPGTPAEWNHDNDVMDYDACQCAWTPCQLGVVHEYLTNYQPSYVEKVWCNYDDSKSITIHNGENIIWNSSRYLQGNIFIEDGGRLTIQCSVYLPENAKVIVKPNGLLNIDGGKISSSCGAMWAGIEIWGNKDKDQAAHNGRYEQGRVQMYNGGVIENAVTAIALWKTDDYTTAGGIITANNSSFLNNYRAVQFIPYHNSVSNSSVPVSNASYFTNCTFTTDEAYLGPDNFYAFITMSEVEGVKINHCSFSNDRPYTTEADRGYGIFTLGANYSLNPVCQNAAVSPCPPENLNGCQFRGLTYGIFSANDQSANSFIVNHAEFIDNAHGVYDAGVNLASIINCTFKLGANTICPDLTCSGVELENCTGYSVEENTFLLSNNSTTQANYIGIRVYSNESSQTVSSNEIYKNNFIGITIGNLAEGQNVQSIPPFSGLQYTCNTNNNNTYDFQVKDRGISKSQGKKDKPANNTFSFHDTPLGSDFDNLSTLAIDYWFQWDVPGCTPENVVSVNIHQTAAQNTCPSHFNNGNIQLSLAPDQINQLSLDYVLKGNSLSLIDGIFNNLKDGGNTQNLSQDIALSTPDKSMDLRDKLLGKSPHLSREILQEAADKSDVLPNTLLFDILAANPEELKDETFLSYLKEKAVPMSEDMIDLLRGFSADTNYKSTLEQELNFLDLEKSRDVFQILRSDLNDSIPDMINYRNWLADLHCINFDYSIIDSWLQEKDVNSASTLLNILPYLYALDSASVVEYNYFKTLKELQGNLIEQGENIFQLNPDQISIVNNIADNSKGVAGTQAMAILEFGYGIPFPRCDEALAPLISKKTPKPGRLYNFYESQLNASPNPSKNWTCITYSLPKGTVNAKIEISDLKSTLMKSFEISNSRGQIIWDTRGIPSGLYFVTMMSNESLKSIKLMVNN